MLWDCLSKIMKKKLEIQKLKLSEFDQYNALKDPLDELFPFLFVLIVDFTLFQVITP